MAHYEEDYEYEPERKSHFWSKFLAVLLGFILGLICTLGGLAGIGYVLFAKIKIKDGFDTVNKITGSDIDYTEYISKDGLRPSQRLKPARLRLPKRQRQPFFFGKILPHGAQNRRKTDGTDGRIRRRRRRRCVPRHASFGNEHVF